MTEEERTPPTGEEGTNLPTTEAEEINAAVQRTPKPRAKDPKQTKSEKEEKALLIKGQKLKRVTDLKKYICSLQDDIKPLSDNLKKYTAELVELEKELGLEPEKFC